MDYQVWTKDDYGDTYTKVDCGDLAAAEREIDKAVRAGREPILTVIVPYELSIKIEDVGTEKKPPTSAKEKYRRGIEEETGDEAGKSKTEPS